MKKSKAVRFAEGAVSELSALIICFAAAFTAVITVGFIAVLLSGREITDGVVVTFYVLAFAAWILLFLLAKKSQRVRSLLGVEFVLKTINMRKIALIFMIIAILLVCFAIAHGLTSIGYAITGSMPEAQTSREFWSFNLLLWTFLLFLVKKFLWARLPFGNRFISRGEIVQGVAMTVVITAVILGGLVVAYFLAFVLYAIFMGQSVPEEGPPFFHLLWNYSGVLIFFLLRWYLKHSDFTRNIRLLSDVMNTLESIAKGDFSVRLNHSLKENEPFAKLVKGVNEMALNLEQTENMRQEFISNVSHEIQSPLASIKGFTYILHNDELTPEERKYFLSIIETETMRLSRLSENLLKLAALEADSVKFEPKPYRLDKQLRALILSCEPQWSEKKIKLDAFLDSVTVTADEDMMSQVWVNLIHNSIKFTPEGGGIQVDLHRNGNTVECKISDTGIGIDKDAQKHIFERFYKADKSRERAKKGSGLGLAIVKKIVETHGGKITVQSEPGAGTVFTVALPM
ncbi:sensor histidine kinase [Ruminiclostridium cellobioparum]|jgi:two-component system phosphate regulon sensor histidine kinase PhoR|uniref:sensor histidine kinase n=1 Tax=Ruminiclostridium cellobioparum TaxID=29355 RepID=UPI0028B0E67A|nr:HAMP domain-containing sensor histidine kinase [Ruminiclostridium cellobioparum]